MVLLLVLGACRTPTGASRAVPPLVHEGEVLLYLQPLAADAERLQFTVGSIDALAGDGGARPLELIHAEVRSAPIPRQQLLARGRLSPGAYQGFLVKIGKATLGRDGERSDLLVPAEPSRIDAAFTVKAGEAIVLWATLRPRESLSSRFAFAPAVAVASPPPAIPDLVGYCTNAATNDVTVFDRVRHQVLGVIATGRAPHGIALDALAGRAFVAVEGAGDVEVIDVAQGRIVGRVALNPGDEPRDVGLTPDGRILVSVNRGSNSASFLNPDSWVERAPRARTGDLPTRLVLDRSGKRAFVLNSTSNDVTVLDLDHATVVGTFRTESEPVAAAVDRTGSVLYVVLRGSPYLSVISAPDFALLRRIFVGTGATSVIADPRTDRLYVGAGRSGLHVFEPAGFTPVGLIELPGFVSDMVIMNTERVLLALMPGEQSIAAVDLTSGRILSLFDVGGAPHELAVSGAQH
jgi:DNA-binding beta-propeller fold protein YncE